MKRCEDSGLWVAGAGGSMSVGDDDDDEDEDDNEEVEVKTGQTGGESTEERKGQTVPPTPTGDESVETA